MNVNDMGIDELRLVVQELRRYLEIPPAEFQRMQDKIEQLREKLARMHWDADCHTTGERGADHCLLEGTHICMLCRLVDDRREIKRLQAIIREQKIGLDCL